MDVNNEGYKKQQNQLKEKLCVCPLNLREYIVAILLHVLKVLRFFNMNQYFLRRAIKLVKFRSNLLNCYAKKKQRKNGLEKLYNQFLRLLSFVAQKSGIKELKVILFMVLGALSLSFQVPPTTKGSTANINVYTGETYNFIAPLFAY